ncbi:hypothetical protein DKG79_06865 [Escherichia fergusonii]|nr:hypothetical protein DKG79_06865 [Escherichia fergusonii]PQI98682.1 hypothetical protein C5U38_01270 [Escherichia fergusonii]
MHVFPAVTYLCKRPERLPFAAILRLELFRLYTHSFTNDVWLIHPPGLSTPHYMKFPSYCYRLCYL